MKSKRILAGIIITLLAITSLLAISVAPHLLGLMEEFYLDQEEYQAAINVSSAGILPEPGNAELYRVRAEANKNTSESNQALDDINQAISLFELVAALATLGISEAILAGAGALEAVGGSAALMELIRTALSAGTP